MLAVVRRASAERISGRARKRGKRVAQGVARHLLADRAQPLREAQCSAVAGVRQQVVLAGRLGADAEQRAQRAAREPALREARTCERDALAADSSLECQAEVDKLRTLCRLGPCEARRAKPRRPRFERRAQQRRVSEIGRRKKRWQASEQGG